MCDTKTFTSIGICGGGKMGLSFFKYLSRFSNYSVVFHIRDTNRIARLKKKYCEMDLCVSFTDRIEDLCDCDIVFEFVAEEISIKREIMQKLLESGKNPSQILATGSSSFTPGRLSAEYDRYNLIGVHYLYPVQDMQTVEVVYGDRTPMDLVDKVCLFLEHIGKIPVRIGEGTGCITTRVLTVIGNEAYRIHGELHIPFSDLDEIISDSGYTLPPFTLKDNVGLDTIYNCICGHYEFREEFESFFPLREYLNGKLKQGHLGKKSGEGFYRYKNQEDFPKPVENKVPEEIKAKIKERIKLLYINSSFELVDRGYADCVELDRIFCEINGNDKGPVRTLFQEGAEVVVERLKKYSQEIDSLYRPLPVLEYISKYSQGSEEIDRQVRDFKMGGKRPDWYP